MEVRPVLAKREHPIYDNDYSINTDAIMALFNDVNRWIENQSPGGIIYGKPRLGKTKAIGCITKLLRKEYNPDLPIFQLNMTFHKLNEKRFYEQFLNDIGNTFAAKGTTFEKKERLINYLINCALEAKSKKIILFIDEANYLEEKEYSWLMDIYNRLQLNGIHMTTLLVGTSEVLVAKQMFIKRKLQQLVGRFMVHEHQFHGVREIKDLQICLASYDFFLKYPVDSDWTYTRYFFPEAYQNGYRLSNDAELIFDCFEKLNEEVNLTARLDIPMQYIILAINICLKDYGADKACLERPGLKEWKTAIINAGYLQAERTNVQIEKAQR